MARGESHSDLPRHLGDFRIEREIGRGGMGVVYEAWQESLGRTVALKVLEAHLTRQPATVERFHREAAAAAGLHHPNILPVYSSGEEDGAHYFAMERIEGVPLDMLLDEVRGNDEVWIDSATVRSFATHPERDPVDPEPAARTETDSDDDDDHMLHDLVERYRQHPIERICRLVLQMASALDYAHGHRLLHRDVKTSNILLRPDGNAVLIDFGLARDLEGPSLTRTGDLVGSPYTLAPEQILAHPDQLDLRVDVYALGVVLYELLTLRRPFEGKSFQDLLQKIQSRDPVPPRRCCRNVPRDLETICLKALEKDPEARYQSCREMAEDLRRFLAYLPILSRPTGWYRRGRKFFRRQRAASLSAAALVVILAGALIWSRTRLAHVEILTDPPGASVMLDGAWQDGVTPLRLPVKAGRHRIEVVREDHEAEVRELELGPGALREVSLQLASSEGWVRVETDPAGATVRFEGAGGPVVPEDTTPLQVRLQSGDYQVELRHEGFEPGRRSLTVPSRGRSEALVHRWPTGLLQVEASQTGAVVELFQGERCEGTPLRTVTLPLHDSVALAPGTYSIRSRVDGHDECCREGRLAIEVPANGRAVVVLWHAPLVWELLARTRRPVRELLAGDRDGDGVRDAVAVGPDGWLTFLGPDGRVVGTCDAGFEPLCTAWFDRDGFQELLLGGAEGQVAAVDHTGRVRPLFEVAGALTTFVAAAGVLYAATDTGELVTWRAATAEVQREVVAPTVAGMVNWRGRLALVTADALIWREADWHRPLEGSGLMFQVRSWHAEGDGPLALLSWGNGVLRRVPVDGPAAEVLAGAPITAWTSWDEAGVLVVGRGDGSVVLLEESGQVRIARNSGRPVQHLVPVRLDGRHEDLAILCEDRIEVLHADRSLRFRVDHSIPVTSVVALDPDGRGAEALVLGGEDGGIRLLGVDRRQVRGWDTGGHQRLRTGDWLPVPGDETLVQIDASRLELLSGEAGRLRQVSCPAPLTDWAVANGPEPWLVMGSAEGLWGGPLVGGELRQLSQAPVRRVATGDLDDDAVPEVVVAYEDGSIVARFQDAAPRFSTGLTGKGVVQELHCLEATGSREAEVVVGTDEGVVVILDSMGRPGAFRRVAAGITHLLPIRERPTYLVLVDETEVHFLDRRLNVHASVSAGDPVRGLVRLADGENTLVVAGTDGGELIAWEDGDHVWSVDLSSPVLAMTTRTMADGAQDLVVMVEDEVLVVKPDGHRAAAWSRTVQDDVLALADVDADGAVEVLLGMADGLRADALLEDPRHRRRQRFMDALVTEADGAEPSMRRDLLEAGLSWLHLESGDLDEVRARLVASDEEQRRRTLEVLELVRPAGTLGWVRCVAWQVDQAGAADALIRATHHVPAPRDPEEAAAAAAILERAVRRLERERREVPPPVQVKLGELQQIANADDPR